MALRYFAGGNPLEIVEVHGDSDGEVVTSTWDVVDTIHQSTKLAIKFPKTYEDQM